MTAPPSEPHARFTPRPPGTPLRCPYCAHSFDALDGEDPADRPEDGHTFVCLHCLGVGVFVFSPLLGGRVRAATPGEHEDRRAQTGPVIAAIIDARSRGLSTAAEIVGAWRGDGRPRALGSVGTPDGPPEDATGHGR